MKLLCIDNKGIERHLTIGKIYSLEYIDTYKHGSVIKNDMRFYDIYPMWRFKPLYEIRNTKIENILNDGTI
jgi:hypothetical protein